MSRSSPLLALLALLLSLALVQAHLRVFNLRARRLPALVGTTDAYVKVTCGAEELGETEVLRDNKHPWWSEEFHYFQAQQNDLLTLEVFDHDLLKDDQLGVCQTDVQSGTHHEECELKWGAKLFYSYTLE